MTSNASAFWPSNAPVSVSSAMPIQNAVSKLKCRGAINDQYSSTTATQSGRSGATDIRQRHGGERERRREAQDRHPPVATRGHQCASATPRCAARLRGRAATVVGRIPDEQHLAIAVERGRGLRDDLGERLIGPPLHLEHAADGVASREHAAEARRDQQVADVDVGVVREIRQTQAAAVAGADGDRAQAVAVHADGHGVIRVGDQHGLRRQRADAHDLTDDALRVDQRLSDDTRRRRARDSNRSAADTGRGRRRGSRRRARGCRCAPSNRAARAAARSPPRARRAAAAAPSVSSRSRRNCWFSAISASRAANVSRIVAPSAERQIDEHADGIHDDGQCLAHAHEMLVAAIEQHQRDANDREQQETSAHGEPASTEAWMVLPGALMRLAPAR